MNGNFKEVMWVIREISRPLICAPPPTFLTVIPPKHKTTSFSSFQWLIPKLCLQGCHSSDSHWESIAQRRDHLNYIVRFISAFKFLDSMIDAVVKKTSENGFDSRDWKRRKKVMSPSSRKERHWEQKVVQNDSVVISGSTCHGTYSSEDTSNISILECGGSGYATRLGCSRKGRGTHFMLDIVYICIHVVSLNSHHDFRIPY